MKFETLFIEPSDVWFFRTGKPFTKGEDQWAATHFPPTPNTIQGAIRSRVLAGWGGLSHGDDPALVERVGNQNGYGKLHLRGPFLAKCERDNGGGVIRYFPAPLDLMQAKESNKALRRLRVGEWNGCETNLPDDDLHPLLLEEDEAQFEAAQGWLSEGELRKYLKNELPAALEPDGKLFRTETRLGIQMNMAQRVTKQQQLYQADFIRPQTDVGLALEIGVEGEDKPLKALCLPQQGYLALGGEARAAHFWTAGQPQNFPEQKCSQGEKFIVYFATPTYFENGWLPKNKDWSPFFGSQVKLIAAAVGRPALIGGWDLKKRGPKPIRRYVPAGSVYYFEASNGPITLKTPVTDNNDEARIGFGQAFIGHL